MRHGVDSLKRQRLAAMRFGICASALAGCLTASAAVAQTVGSGPGGVVAGAKAKVDAEAARVAAAVDAEVARLGTFLEKAEVAKDRSMEAAGLQTKARLEREISRLIETAKAAIPKDGSFEPASSANACRQANGADTVKQGSATCTATGVNGGKAVARADGDRSSATAKGGDSGRAAQAGNVADAVATGGASATSNAGIADYDENNKTTAVASDGALSVAEANSGDRNVSFAGAINNGEARASARVGDRNLSISFGSNGSNDGNGPLGSRSTASGGFDNITLSGTNGPNAASSAFAGVGDRNRSAAFAGPNGNARSDSGQGDDSYSFSQASDHAHALAFNSYGNKLLAVAKSKGDGGTGNCAPIGRAANSGQTNYPPDECATASARSVDGVENTAISVVDKAKAFSLAERGGRNTAVTRASNGGNIIWNTAPSAPPPAPGAPASPFQGAPQAPNPHAGMKADCPWPLPPLPQAQQACGNATAKASYGNGNLAVTITDGDHSFGWSEASGGAYGQALVTAMGRNSQARAIASYSIMSTAKAHAKDGGKARSAASLGYQNIALANATGEGANAEATVAGNFARATAAAMAGGSAKAVHNTGTGGAFGATDSKTQVVCSSESVAYAMIGNGQSCGKGF